MDPPPTNRVLYGFIVYFMSMHVNRERNVDAQCCQWCLPVVVTSRNYVDNSKCMQQCIYVLVVRVLVQPYTFLYSCTVLVCSCDTIPDMMAIFHQCGSARTHARYVSRHAPQASPSIAPPRAGTRMKRRLQFTLLLLSLSVSPLSASLCAPHGANDVSVALCEAWCDHPNHCSLCAQASAKSAGQYKPDL